MIDYIVIAVIVLILGGIATNYIKRKKEGKSGSGCSGCSSCHVKDCHSRQ